jgi:hypothetical protein
MGRSRDESRSKVETVSESCRPADDLRATGWGITTRSQGPGVFKLVAALELLATPSV